MATGEDKAPQFHHEHREGYLYLHFVGTFTTENIAPFLDHVADLIRIEGRTQNILTDLREAFQGDRGLIKLLSRFVKGNRPYVRKSAMIVSSGTKRFLFDVGVRLSGRKNVRPFTTIEDAEIWLAKPLKGEG